MGDKGVMAVGDEMGEGMQCADHPYRNNPGGICAFCLQEKLGKLVSSNGSGPFLSIPSQPSSSSSSPSFRSEYGTTAPIRTAGYIPGGSGGGGRNRVPFLSAATITQKKKISGGGGGLRKVIASSSSTTTSSSNMVVLKRSKSVAPRPLGEISDTTTTDSPRKKSFWSFLSLSSSSSSFASTAATSSSGNKRRSTSSGTGSDNSNKDLKPPPPPPPQQQKQESTGNASKQDQEASVAESPGGSQVLSSSFGRKVARSRSVGCGSRSFSGDFLERISTGFGDCTLRRVESHRESNTTTNKKIVLHRHDSDEQRIKERVKCGGIFGGFGMISSSSSTYWLSAAAAAAEDDFDMTSNRIGSNTARASTSAAIVRGVGGRSRGWGWAFASPMRAFKPTTSSSSSKSNAITGNGGSSNGKVGANPSMLAVGG